LRFTSYAQIHEDWVLLRALRHVPRGFYIDVGAQHPTVGSVTKLFYDRGWRGINIEPVSHWFDQLVEQRSRDINLRIAVDAVCGEAVLYEIPESGLSTTVAKFAERHRAAGWACRSRSVPTRSLAEICREYVQGEIHFLKIDAEGSEYRVLQGGDFARYRPWIVLIEATEPLTDVPAYQESEAVLVPAGYEFAGTDLLNRYYVAREHAALKRHIGAGIRMVQRRVRLILWLRRVAWLRRVPLVRRFVR
jgi:FkbM family methyltransferase